MKSEIIKTADKKANKPDFTGIFLFVLGVTLIGFSIFNLFEDSITNQYYKIKRNLSFSTIGILFSPAQPTIFTILTDTTTPLKSNPSSPQQINSTLIADIETDNIEGFLPLNIEVSEITKPTSNETKEYDIVPIRLSIPVIDLNADIINATNKEIIQGDKTFIQWLAPDEFAIGWHFDTAFLDEPGNTVLNGHHNIFGKVFENLDKLVSGDEIFIYGNDLNIYQYLVTNTMILPERDVPIEERLENARWILPSDDERVTLITCWPYFSNTHRLIIVARPLSSKPVLMPNERN